MNNYRPTCTYLDQGCITRGTKPAGEYFITGTGSTWKVTWNFS